MNGQKFSITALQRLLAAEGKSASVRFLKVFLHRFCLLARVEHSTSGIPP